MKRIGIVVKMIGTKRDVTKREIDTVETEVMIGMIERGGRNIEIMIESMIEILTKMTKIQTKHKKTPRKDIILIRTGAK